MIRHTLSFVFAATLLVALASAAVQATTQGPEQITIFGGSRGKVPFPHAQHQVRIKDCSVCHSLFPQEPDALKKMKAQGDLKPKKVMNAQCIRCHRADKRAGQPHGPLTCKTCSQKN